MAIVRLDHYNIRAPRKIIDGVIVFYKKILGLVPGPRPDFGIPGEWLYDGDYPIVHLAVDETATPPPANQHFNHVAFRCRGMDGYIQRLNAMKVPVEDVYVPELDMTQLFFYDPAGVLVELDFPNEKKPIE